MNLALHGPAPRLVLDVETYSTVDLARAGAHAYATHADTGVHCAAWLISQRGVPVAWGVWTPGQPAPAAIGAHVRAGHPIVAHNWLFEYNVWMALLLPQGWPLPDWGTWSCTMARALYWGLPAGLEDVGRALQLTTQKDAGGRDNMLRMARPRAHVEGQRPTWWHQDPKEGPPRLKRLYDYCARDCDTEAELDARLPELPPHERALFSMDGEINQRGVAIDLELVDALQGIIDQEAPRLHRLMRETTGGVVRSTNQVGALSTWLEGQGIEPGKLDKGRVAALLASPGISPGARAALELRQEAARASTAKLRAMRDAVSSDSRARGLLQYCGAGRTGRWAGRRVQGQNMVRPTVKQPIVDAAVQFVTAGADAGGLVALFPDTPMGMAANCLRSCIVAGPGNVLVSVDLAQIEARVVAWLSGQADILDVFARGEDVYTYTAKSVGSDSRQFGKVLVLACGFGMGWRKFKETSAGYGIALDDEAAEAAVGAWRAANRATVGFWYRLGEEFRYVCDGADGTRRKLGLLEIHRWGRAVVIVLPSGHELVYQEAQTVEDGAGRPEIVYHGVNQLTRQWGIIRTWGGKLVENVVQAVARDVLACQMLELTVAKQAIVASIHDEVVLETAAEHGQALLAYALGVFRRAPRWAATLPLGAEGWVARRYRKG